MKKRNLYLIPLSVLVIGCGSTEDNTTAKGEGAIDLRTYFEKEDISKKYTLINKEVDRDFTRKKYNEDSVVTASKIERRLKDTTIITKTIDIGEKNLTLIDVSDEGNIKNVFFRNVDLGETLFTAEINTTQLLKIGNTVVGSQIRVGTNSCKLIEKRSEFIKDSYPYQGDILKTECTKTTTITTKVDSQYVKDVNYINGTEDSVDISYYYQMKDIGLIASINDDCVPPNMTYPDDTIQCSDKNKSYSYMYYEAN